MVSINLFIFLFLLFSGQKDRESLPEEPVINRLSIVFAGDVMGHDGQISGAWDEQKGVHQYDTCFSLLKPFIEKHDIAVANLEVTLAGPPYSGYPAFSSPDALAGSLKSAGFDLLITANNHSLDKGSRGLERTIKVLDSLGMIHTGTFYDKVQRDTTYPLILEKNNIRIAILNYTYGTNGIKVKAPNVVNYIDTVQIAADLEKAATALPDFTIVTIHWGNEYEREENAVQRSLAKFMHLHGADAVIGMHPHVIQTVKMEQFNSADSGMHCLVAYSLGNYISNQRERYRNGGIMLSIELEKAAETRLSNYSYLPVYVHRKAISTARNQFVLVPANAPEEWLSRNGVDEANFGMLRTFKADTENHLAGVPVFEFVPDSLALNAFGNSE